MKIQVVLTLDYGNKDFYDVDEEIEDLKVIHPIADVVIEDYTEVDEETTNG